MLSTYSKQKKTGKQTGKYIISTAEKQFLIDTFCRHQFHLRSHFRLRRNDAHSKSTQFWVCVVRCTVWFVAGVSCLHLTFFSALATGVTSATLRWVSAFQDTSNSQESLRLTALRSAGHSSWRWRSFHQASESLANLQLAEVSFNSTRTNGFFPKRLRGFTR